MHIYTLCILFFVSLICASLCAFLETASTGLRLFQLREMEACEHRYKSLLNRWIDNSKQILVAILIANNFAHVLTSVLISEIMQRLFGSLGVAIGVALATVLILVFGEILPKSFAQTRHKHALRSFLWLINGFVFCFRPLVRLLLQVANTMIVYVGGNDTRASDDEISEKEIKFLIDYASEKELVDGMKLTMLRNVFSLGQHQVKEITVPKTEIITLEVNATLEKASRVFHETRFSRLPVYETEHENIIGIVLQKDIFEVFHQEGEKKPLKEYVRPVLFVPETQKISQLLNDFLKQHMHMAVVLSEHGVVTGVVTLEDILEEIVGDIADEHEKKQETIVCLDEDNWSIAGNAELKQVEEMLKITFHASSSVTLGGFLAEYLQHVPRKGEFVNYQDYHFQVQHANMRKVLNVLVFKSSRTNCYAPEGESPRALHRE